MIKTIDYIDLRIVQKEDRIDLLCDYFKKIYHSDGGQRVYRMFFFDNGPWSYKHSNDIEKGTMSEKITRAVTSRLKKYNIYHRILKIVVTDSEIIYSFDYRPYKFRHDPNLSKRCIPEVFYKTLNTLTKLVKYNNIYIHMSS